MVEPDRLLWIVLVTAAWLALSVLCWYRHRKAHSAMNARFGTGGEPAEDVLVAYASQSGTAARLALDSAQALGSCLAVRLMPLNEVDDSVLRNTRRAVFIASTHGEGEPPDNGAVFYRRFLSGRSALDLSHLEFAVLALGDRTYQRFCAFGRSLQQGLELLGARPLCEMTETDRSELASLDVLPSRWRVELNRLAPSIDFQAPNSGKRTVNHDEVVSHWTISARQCLNPDSEASSIYRLWLSPVAAMPIWQAGDIIEVRVRNNIEGGRQPWREYSAASVSEEDTLQLLIRLRFDETGKAGLGGGWLTQQASHDDILTIRVRSNPNFHGPEPERAMILIGAGSGLAGLRAHLAERAAKRASGPNWLLFGERSSAHDRLLDDELSHWLETGHLTLLNRTFSRDEGAEAGKGRYIQDLLRKHRNDVERWVHEGAAIYVCGSLAGMGEGVHAALVEILGQDTLERLLLSGLYRRDVY